MSWGDKMSLVPTLTAASPCHCFRRVASWWSADGRNIFLVMDESMTTADCLLDLTSPENSNPAVVGYAPSRSAKFKHSPSAHTTGVTDRSG
jgi:hypothetical protein